MRTLLSAAVVTAALSVPPAVADPVPGLSRVGQCAATRIRSVSQRLIDGSTDQVIAGSGSAVELANGVYGVSYDQVPAVNMSRTGDAVKVCLVSIPRHCPKGDGRGRYYKATNLRTHKTWTLPDAEHMCGGA